MRIQILILGLKAKPISILISGIPGPSVIAAATPGKDCRNLFFFFKCKMCSLQSLLSFKIQNVNPHRKKILICAHLLLLNVSFKIKVGIQLYYSPLKSILLESGKTRRN